jgi:lactoylglutathione lyase
VAYNGGDEAMNLLVLRCGDIDRCWAFYETLGLSFVRHRHGQGPEHYAHEDERGVIELYAARTGAAADRAGLRFWIEDIEALRAELERKGFGPEAVKDTAWGRTFVVPDGRA